MLSTSFAPLHKVFQSLVLPLSLSLPPLASLLFPLTTITIIHRFPLNLQKANMSQVTEGTQMTAAGATAADTNNTATAAAPANGNGNGHAEGYRNFDNEKGLPHQAPQYNGTGGKDTYLNRTLTPGGHFADDDLIAIANAHRRIANPLPLGGELLTVTPIPQPHHEGVSISNLY